jgi:hypothetical protein
VAPDWVTISSLATGGGTLILAVSTFAAVRSANRAARVAEQALMIGLRPLLVPSWLSDGVQKIYYGDGKRIVIAGGTGAAEADREVIYLGISVRNAGRGIAVVHGWRFEVANGAPDHHPDLSEFRMQSRDLYIPPSDMGFWQGAFRDPGDPAFDDAYKAVTGGEPLTIDVLYGDYEGGQRAISRYLLRRHESQAQLNTGEQARWLASVIRHWNVDRPDPRRPSASAGPVHPAGGPGSR